MRSTTTLFHAPMQKEHNYSNSKGRTNQLRQVPVQTLGLKTVVSPLRRSQPPTTTAPPLLKKKRARLSSALCIIRRFTPEVVCHSGRNPTSRGRHRHPLAHLRYRSVPCLGVHQRGAGRYKNGPFYISPHARLRQELTLVEQQTRRRTHKPFVLPT